MLTTRATKDPQIRGIAFPAQAYERLFANSRHLRREGRGEAVARILARAWAADA